MKKLSQDPRTHGIDGTWELESGDEIGEAHSEGRIFETETRKVADGWNVTGASAILPLMPVYKKIKLNYRSRGNPSLYRIRVGSK